MPFMQSLNLRQLRVFRAVAECGSISGAAEQVHISQSVVSRHVQSLESSLGVALLDRLPRGVELTEAGAILADYARRLFALEAEARFVLEDLRNVRAGRLHIGASMTIGNYLLPPVLAAYHERHPGVEVHLDVANTETIQHQLLDRKLDIGFTEGFVDDEELAVDVFLHDELIVVASAMHALARMGQVSMQELGDHPCIMREPGSGTRAVLERALSERSLSLSTTLAFSSAEAVKQAVMAGYGFAITSRHTVRTELANGELVQVPVRDFVLRRPLHRLQIRHKRPSQSVLALLALMRERLAPGDTMQAPGATSGVCPTARDAPSSSS